MSQKARDIEERKEFVRANHKTMTARAMAEHFGVTQASITSMCRKMGLKKSDSPSPLPWTKEHTQKLVLLYASHSNKTLAALFGRTEFSIYSKAAEMSLKKSSELRAAIALAASARLLDAKKLIAASKPSPIESPRVHTTTREKERITYTPETLPWKARALAQPWTPPNLTYRGQVAA